jgi:hypothetical protein
MKDTYEAARRIGERNTKDKLIIRILKANR